jgi:hypothetical protein
MESELVEKHLEVLANIKELVSYRDSVNISQKEYYKERIKKGKVFVVEILNGNIEFTPSKFVGYKNNTMENHKKLQSIERDGRDTDAQLVNLQYKKIENDEKINQLFSYFSERHDLDVSPYKTNSSLKYLIKKDNYKDIIDIGYKKIPFYNVEDIRNLSVNGGKKYRKEDSNDVKIGLEIRDKLYEKTNYWARSIKVPGFIIEEGTNWQVMGYFAQYTWARILKQRYKDYRVYFTIGVDYGQKALIYKLDCQRKNANRGATSYTLKLTDDQIRIFDELVEGSGAEWHQINIEEISEYTWDMLVEETINFVKLYESLYEKVIQHIWAPVKVEESNEIVVGQGEFLKNATNKKVEYGGHVKTNWTKVHEERTKLGKEGEYFVLEYEINELKRVKRDDLVPKVEHTTVEKGDGFGYDILSFTKEGKPKYIEVKTTSLVCNSPIYISRVEYEVSQKKKDDYYLYRVYDFDKIAKTGKIKVINGSINENYLEVDGYKANIK